MQYSESGDPFTAPPPNMKESFEVGSEDNDFMPNIWLPEGVLPGFKEGCLGFYWVCFPSGSGLSSCALYDKQKCHEVEKNILRALALGFGLEEEWFLRYHKTANNQLRLLHYPRYGFTD
jgi:isopenicillin N synthase-like dioxygenase